MQKGIYTSVASLSLALSACNGALWGSTVFLFISFSVFYGTVSMGRQADKGESSRPKVPPSTTKDSG